jgi:hypothetical protein
VVVANARLGHSRTNPNLPRSSGIPLGVDAPAESAKFSSCPEGQLQVQTMIDMSHVIDWPQDRASGSGRYEVCMYLIAAPEQQAEIDRGRPVGMGEGG